MIEEYHSDTQTKFETTMKSNNEQLEDKIEKNKEKKPSKPKKESINKKEKLKRKRKATDVLKPIHDNKPTEYSSSVPKSLFSIRCKQVFRKFAAKFLN